MGAKTDRRNGRIRTYLDPPLVRLQQLKGVELRLEECRRHEMPGPFPCASRQQFLCADEVHENAIRGGGP